MAGRGHDSSSNTSDDDVIGPVTVSRARIDELRDKGKAVAAYLRENQRCFQEQACLHAGILPRTYYRWLENDGEEYVAFQREVLPALLERAAADRESAEKDVASAEGGSSAWSSWHRWELGKRYRKIFGDLAEHRVELTGKDGGAMRHEHSLENVPTSELLATLRATRRAEDE